MRYEDFVRAVLGTEPDDWIMHGATRVLRADLNVRIEGVEPETPDGEYPKYKREWARELSPHHPPLLVNFLLWYGSSPVEEFALVALDEFRAFVPSVSRPPNVVLRKHYQLACALCGSETVDGYLGRATVLIAD